MTLHCRNLSYFVEQRPLFQKLSVDFPQAKLTAILGPNGSGKSTLLALLAGIGRRQEGDIFLNDRHIDTLPLRFRARQMAYLPQQSEVYINLQVEELVLLGRAPYRWLSPSWKEEDHIIARKSLELVGLEEYLERRIHSLSGGERQRAMLARMLATEAEILLLDEAITALDIHHSLAFLKLCKKLCIEEKKTILLSIHQLELALRYCDYTLLLGAPNKNYYLYGPAKKTASIENLSQIFQVNVQKKAGNIFFNLE